MHMRLVAKSLNIPTLPWIVLSSRTRHTPAVLGSHTPGEAGLIRDALNQACFPSLAIADDNYLQIFALCSFFMYTPKIFKHLCPTEFCHLSRNAIDLWASQTFDICQRFDLTKFFGWNSFQRRIVRYIETNKKSI